MKGRDRSQNRCRNCRFQGVAVTPNPRKFLERYCGNPEKIASVLPDSTKTGVIGVGLADEIFDCAFFDQRPEEPGQGQFIIWL